MSQALSLPTQQASSFLKKMNELDLRFAAGAVSPRQRSFWLRWSSLHKNFMRKLSNIRGEGPNVHRYMESEFEKLLTLRKALLSSALQFFRRAPRDHADEARIFASMIEDSDKVVMSVISLEVIRLKEIHATTVRNRRVIGAYSRR